MLEHVHIRLNDHQINSDGVKEYSVEVSVPGRYTRTFIGTNQEAFLQNVQDAFTQIFTLMGIPANQPHSEALPVQEAAPPQQQTPVVMFFNADGTPQKKSPFAATANAKFDAQVIRNGKVVED
jgi:hypothetical protein